MYRTLRYIFASKNTQGERWGILFSARPECSPQAYAKENVSKGLILLFTFFTTCSTSPSNLVTHTVKDIDPYTKEVAISFVIPKKDFLYKDFIAFSVDNPHIILSSWKADKQSVTHYDSSFKEAKHIFNEDVIISLSIKNNIPEACTFHLYCSYYRKSEKKINHILFPLTFSALPIHTEEPCNSIEIIEHHTATLKPVKKESSSNWYVNSAIAIINVVINSIKIDHKKYFAFVIFIIMVLISFFYFFKKELEIHRILKEWIEVIISLLLCISATYLLFYFHTFTTPLTTIIIAAGSILYAGIFYIKKSTKVQSKNLRTLCTFMGMLCLSSILLLAFKAVQYADQQFDLLQ